MGLWVSPFGCEGVEEEEEEEEEGDDESPRKNLRGRMEKEVRIVSH